MKLETTTLNDQDIQTTAETGVLTLSPDSESQIFEIFTKRIYSNAIGSIVREITSNCFDSHVEAGVDDPIIIRHTFDKITDSHYLSFIDFGVGISPDRFKNIYSQYFTSTKRNTNEQHGAFGLGAKTPLAYRRQIGMGEDEIDNSFSVITRFDGKEYQYLIYSGNKTPQWTLPVIKDTTEHNGTEIKIPILEKDLGKFIQAIRNQLFYFENIVYEGFEEIKSGLNNELNNYKIYKGKNFIFRKNAPENFIHIALGRVLYPINYNALDLNQYDYSLRVAIQVPIGSIDVTTSRENIDYSQNTIKYLIKRINEVMNELKAMYRNQYTNVRTLEDFLALDGEKKLYFNMQDNVYIDVKFMIPIGELLINFKYKEIAKTIKNNGNYLSAFYTLKKYGKPEYKSYRKHNNDEFSFSLSHILSNRNNKTNLNFVFFSEKNYYTEFKASRVKNSYLKETAGSERIYIIFKNDLENKSDSYLGNDKISSYKTELQNDFWEHIKKAYQNYDTIEVPEEYKLSIKRKKAEKIEWGTKAISMYAGNSSRFTYPVKNLTKVKRVYYTTLDHNHSFIIACRMYTHFMDRTYLMGNYNRIERNPKVSTAIIRIAQSNVKYLKQLPNAKPLNNIYTDLFWRKSDIIEKAIIYENLNEKIKVFNDFLYSKFDIYRPAKNRVFKMLFPDLFKKINEMITLSNYHKFISSEFLNKNEMINKFYEETKIERPNTKKEEEKVEKLITKAKKTLEKYKNILRIIDINNIENDEDFKIIKKILKTFKII